MNNREISVVRGRVLGGCSSINGMLYMRGQRQDYDDWGALPGCEGWSYANMLPYFKKSENYEPGPANDYHAKGGELNVTNVQMKYDISDAYIDAAVSVGIPRNDDINGENQEGIGHTQVNMKGGQRWSSADAFLSADVKKRPNLTIAIKAVAQRVLLDGKKAVGIEYTDAKGNTHQAKASREVVLSAGTYNSPPLLELSGIGNPDVLHDIGVEVKHELPGVGENLQDHFQIWVQQGVKTKQCLSEDGKFPKVVWGVLKYMFAKKGPLTMAGVQRGRVCTERGRGTSDFPDPLHARRGWHGQRRQDGGGAGPWRELDGLHHSSNVTRQCPRPQHGSQSVPEDHSQLPVHRSRPRLGHRGLQTPAEDLPVRILQAARHVRDPGRRVGADRRGHPRVLEDRGHERLPPRSALRRWAPQTIRPQSSTTSSESTASKASASQTHRSSRSSPPATPTPPP